MGNATTAQDKMSGTLGLDLAQAATIYQLFDFHVPVQKAADDGMASTATADTLFWTNPFDFSVAIISATYTPTGTITADNTNFATLTVKKDDGAAGTPAVALTVTTAITDSGNFAANIQKAFTSRTAANATVAAGANLFFNIAKSGSGVVMRAGYITVRLRRV